MKARQPSVTLPEVLCTAPPSPTALLLSRYTSWLAPSSRPLSTTVPEPFEMPPPSAPATLPSMSTRVAVGAREMSCTSKVAPSTFAMAPPDPAAELPLSAM